MRTIVSWIIIIVSFSSIGCGTQDSSFKLDEEWEFRRGFDRSWLTTHDQSKWKKIKIPGLFITPENSIYRNSTKPLGQFTLRKELPREVDLKMQQHRDLVFFIKNLTGHQVELYLNDTFFGKVGSLNPSRPAMSRPFMASLPGQAFQGIGKNAVYVVFTIHNFDRVSHGIYENPEIDEAIPLLDRYYSAQITDFVLITIYLSIGIIFLILGVRLPNSLYSIYFGLFAICFTFFEMANLECRELIFGDSIILRMRIDQVSLKLMIAFFALFITLLFKKKHTKLIIGLTVYCTALAVSDMFRGLEYSLDDRFNLWLPAVAVGFASVLYILIKESFRKNVDAMILVAGVVLFAISSVLNILEDMDLITSQGIPLSYTTLAVFLCVVLMLINRFVMINTELEDLNIYLEKKVEQRTSELEKAGEKSILQKRKESFLSSFNLTYREKEILSLIMEGHPAHVISEKLEISSRTVNNHIYNLYQKMGAHSRMDIIALFEKST
jgi:DNA-binding CsgD family transcriptional regulator